MSEVSPRRAGRPRTPRDRGEFVRAAREEFAAEGYAGATLEAISARLGIRRPALLHHFPSKEALYAEALHSVLAELAEVLAHAIRPGEFHEQLDALSEGLTVYLAGHPEAAGLLLAELVGPRDRTPGATTAVNVLEIAAAFLEAGMAAGEIPRQDPRDLVLSIVGLHLVCFAVPAVSARFLGESPYSPEAAARRAGHVRVQVRRLCGLPDSPLV